MEQDSLIIWVPSVDGFTTLKFGNVSRLFESDKQINFEYDGVSTGEHRAATFETDKIIGYAITEVSK